MKIDYEKYKDIKIDKEKFKDIPTNVEQLRNCLAICYVLMEDKDKEIERLNKELEVYKEFEQWLNNQEEYYSTFSKEIVKTIHWINITLKHKKELKGSDKE